MSNRAAVLSLRAVILHQAADHLIPAVVALGAAVALAVVYMEVKDIIPRVLTPVDPPFLIKHEGTRYHDVTIRAVPSPPRK